VQKNRNLAFLSAGATIQNAEEPEKTIACAIIVESGENESATESSENFIRLFVEERRP